VLFPYLKVCRSGLRDIIGGKQMNGKIGMRAFSMLLALLLVSVGVVPAVSADIEFDTDPSSTEDPDAVDFDVTNFRLPRLQINSTQEETIVSAELSPVEFDGVYTIPQGSIVHHAAEGVTRVFSASGEQIIVAVDNRSEYISTPAGVEKAATFVHRVPENSHIYSKENTIYVTDEKGDVLLVVINDRVKKECETMTVSDRIGSYFGWLEYADDVIPGGLTQFDAYWHVPSAPPAMDYGKAVFIFTGVEPPEEQYGLLQPVLAFYPYENGWNWYGEAWCYATNPYDPDTDSIVGPRISVNSGDKIKGRILWSDTYNQWYVQFSDITTGEYSTLWSSLIPRHNNLEVSVVLEAKAVEDNNDMPGDIEFYNMEFKNNGFPVSGVNFEGHVDSSKPSAITGLWVQEISDPTNIKLHTNN
jgi:hypothetical protein